MKSFGLFLATFLLGAALALGTRTALHVPYAAPADAAVPSASVPVAPALETHSNAAHPVNTVCPICAMDVDPDIKTAAYQGKLVGFGCAACPPKFTKDPDRYGPSALRNEVAPK
jgi:hypothetical protein